MNTSTLTWNTRVILRPNPLGWKIWENYYRILGKALPSHEVELKITLWEAANIFGMNLYNGCNIPFVDMTIGVIE